MALARLSASLRVIFPSFIALTLGVAGCRAPAEATQEPPPKQEAQTVQLPGVDTSALTGAELQKWSSYVSELLAPCTDQPVSVAQCVKESRDCAACLPAAKFLVQRVRRGNTRAQVEGAFRTRFAPEAVKAIDLDDSPRVGAESPKVTVVEWADLECPFCAFAAPLLKKQVERYPDQLQLVFKHYPLSAHQNAETAARGAVAAQSQGKFWPFQEKVFAQQKEGLDRARLSKIAAEVGLDVKRFEADLESETVADRVARDRKQADALNLKGTPMIYINGRHFDFEHFDLREDLEDWIALEVQLASGKGKEPGGAAAPATGAVTQPAASTAAAE